MCAGQAPTRFDLAYESERREGGITIEMVPVHSNDGIALGISLAFALPTLLFWAGLFLGKPRFSMIAVLATTLGIVLSWVIDALIRWAGVSNADQLFYTVLQASIEVSLGMLVFFIFILPSIKESGRK